MDAYYVGVQTSLGGSWGFDLAHITQTYTIVTRLNSRNYSDKEGGIHYEEAHFHGSMYALAVQHCVRGMRAAGAGGIHDAHRRCD